MQHHTSTKQRTDPHKCDVYMDTRLLMCAVQLGVLCALRRTLRHVVSYDDLVSDPVSTVKHIYDTLQWSDKWSAMEPKLKSETQSLRAYQRNAHTPLPREMVELINERWGESFERLGYPMRAPGSCYWVSQNCGADTWTLTLCVGVVCAHMCMYVDSA